ncbi:MAG TPA: hypothetical protein VMB72_04085 [Acidimicrobiales bacterium]|nr:hypothetical protein [Acidimicrobiales bacterium]
MSAPGPGEWERERRCAPAAVLHGPWPPEDRRRRRIVAQCAVTDEAVVLGSTQRPEVLDPRRLEEAGVHAVRRGSGGGAVLVAPGAQVWVDLWLPRPDPLWDDDVIAASAWVGRAWGRALEELGVPGALVHTGRADGAGWAGVLCFAGLGPGEVTVGGAKVVGVAQRRTRHGARLSTMALRRWEPGTLGALLARPPSDDELEALGTLAVGLDDLRPSGSGAGIDDDAVLDAVVRALP